MLVTAGTQSPNSSGDSSIENFHGYTLQRFEVDGIDCHIVIPKTIAGERPWIWRARFWGNFHQADLALLAEGYHVAYADVAGLFGSSQAVTRWNRFYKYAIEELNLNPKPVLEGLSRGGLIIYNWAAQNPEKVSCIYGDAPVCDFKSWPAGHGASEGNPKAWKECLQVYGLTDLEALSYSGNPIDNLLPLAKAGIPLIHVVGTADEVVPVAENTSLLAERYRAMGGEIEIITKEGIGHHPHGLDDPTPVVKFIIEHSNRSQ